MRNSIFKEVYRGYGIYWHGRDGYGDETNAWCNTLREIELVDGEHAPGVRLKVEHPGGWVRAEQGFFHKHKES